MSTDVLDREDLKQRDTGHMDPEWEAWLAMDIPCVVKGCDLEVEWRGNQHGCLVAFSCDPHTARFVSFIRTDIAQNGYTVCNYCKQPFTTLEAFFKAVRV